jgi:hypothetical protein
MSREEELIEEIRRLREQVDVGKDQRERIIFLLERILEALQGPKGTW